MPFDLLPRSLDHRPGEDRPNSSTEFDLDPAPIWPEDDARLEPVFLAGPLWIEFDEADRLSLEPAHPSLDALQLVEFDDSDGVELDRVRQRTDEPPRTPSRHASAISMLGSLAVHLLPLL